MAVRQPDVGQSTSAEPIVGISEAEPVLIADHGTNRKSSDSDSDVVEISMDETTSADTLPRYVDCQETLVELSFIKWLAGFRLESRKMAMHTNKNLFYGLLNFFCVNLASEIIDCRNKTNKSSLLKSFVEQSLSFFRKYYVGISAQERLDTLYYDKMCTLLAYYIDLELMASQRHVDKTWFRKITSKINLALSLYLDERIDYMLDSLFQLYYIFYGNIHLYNIATLMMPVFRKIIIERPVPSNLKYLTYLRYIICCKLWRKTIHSSSLDESNKRRELEKIRLFLRGLTPPLDFMTQYNQRNWPHWPKLTMTPNSTPDKIKSDLKKIAYIIYTSNGTLRDFTKNIFEESRKDIPRLLKSIKEQCVILRPDLYSVNGEEVLADWDSYFVNTLSPLISSTQSCNSLVRQVKYNLYDEEKPKCSDNKNAKNHVTPTNKLIENSKETQLSNKFGVSIKSVTSVLRENVSTSDEEPTGKVTYGNLFNHTVIDENKQNEHCQTTVLLKTVLVNGESFTNYVNVEPQSNEDKMQVNTKKSKSFSDHVTHYRDEGIDKVDTLPSSIINGLDCNADGTSHQSCIFESSSLSNRGLKRPIPTKISENEKSKRACKTKYEKTTLNNVQNKIVNSDKLNQSFDCEKLKHDHIGSTISNKDNLLTNHSKNNQYINGVSSIQYINESSVGEHKWVTKATHPALSESSVLNLKHSQSNISDEGKDENIDNFTSKVIELNSDQVDVASPSSDLQWSSKSSCILDSSESKSVIDNSEKMDVETTCSDTEVNKIPETEHLLSLRNSEETISNLVSSRLCINENENTQIYALPMDQKLTHVEHPYVENSISSSTRDLEVVNVLSPVSINSTDVPMSKSSWVPDMSLVHAHNDVDGEHSQSSTQQFNGLCNSSNINTSCISNIHSEVEHLNHISLNSSNMSLPNSYSRIEPRIYSDDPFTTVLSPSESSVSNSAYGTAYDLNRTSMAVSTKPTSVTVSPKDVIHGLNYSTNGIYHENTLNLSFNGLNKKSTINLPSSYDFSRSTTMSVDMNSVERVSPHHNHKKDVLVVASDEFSDVDSMDLRINITESNENNSCSNSLSLSSLIPPDLKSVNTFNNFDKLGNWSSINNLCDTSNLHKQQNFKIYTDPTELISGPVNLNTQPGLSNNLTEAPRAQKVFLGNKSPSQVYYNPLADFCVLSDVDMANHIDDPTKSNFKNRSNTRDGIDTCLTDPYIHSLLQRTDNDLNVKQTLINGYDGVHSQNSPILNNGLLYNFPRSADSIPTVQYENPVQLHHKNPDSLSPHNGLTYKCLDQIQQTLLEDPNKKEEQRLVNMTHLMLPSRKNAKFHYKWPLDKNKSQISAPNEKIQELPQCVNYKRSVLYNTQCNYTDDELNQSKILNVSPNEIANTNSSLSFHERINDSTLYESNQQFQDISNFIASDLSPTVQSGSDSADEKKQTQSRAVNNFECNVRREQMYRNTKVSNQSEETHSKLSPEIFEAARYLFNEGKLFLCMYPKCTNSHHFRVIHENANELFHKFTVSFDVYRFNIQYQYMQLLKSSTPRTWPSIPELLNLNKRCTCLHCCDYDYKINQNQDMLDAYIKEKKPKIQEDNNENKQPTTPQIKLGWKKNLANRFSSELQSILLMIEDMKRYINHFASAFSIIFKLNKDPKVNLQNLKNMCECYSDVSVYDTDKSLNSEYVKCLDIANTFFIKDLTKNIIESSSKTSYQLPNQNLLNTLHQLNEEHLPNEMNRYYVGNTLGLLPQSVNLNLISPSLKHINENIPNTSHQSAAENSPSTSHQSSVGNLICSPHQPILNNFPTTSHGISPDLCCSPLNDRVYKRSHMSRYYPDGQMYTEFPQTYLQVPSAQFPTSSTNSYYGSPVNMPSDSSVPFRSPSLSVNSIPNSPSSDCSIPSMVETVATAVPEHVLLDDSLEAVNAARNLMLISNRHRYNSTTSITTTNTTDTITVITTPNTNSKTATKIINAANTNNISPADSTNNNFPSESTFDNISVTDTAESIQTSVTDTAESIQPSITNSEDQETDIVHNSRRKKKKKHDKKKDKKKKGKR